MDLNKAMLIGRLVRDPEIRQTGSGQPVASFSLATGFAWKDAAGQKQEKTEFHRIVAWRNLADICGRYLKKGSKIYLEGRLQTREWLDKQNVKHYTTEIVADNMIMLDSRGSSDGAANYGGQPANNYGPQNSDSNDIVYDNLPGNESSGPKDEEISVENIPF